MTKFLMREKNVPRKYRALATYPITDKFEELFAQIRAANEIYTDTPEKVDKSYMFWRGFISRKTPGEPFTT